MKIALGAVVSVLAVSSAVACKPVEVAESGASEAQGRGDRTNSKEVQDLRSEKAALEQELKSVEAEWRTKAAGLRSAEASASRKNAGINPEIATDFRPQLDAMRQDLTLLASRIREIKSRILLVDDRLTSIFAKVKVTNSKSIIAHRQAKAQKVRQLDRQY